MSDKKIKKKKKKTRRGEEKYPSLKRNLNSKVRQEMIDYDYINGHKDPDTGKINIRALTDEEKQFLEDFNSEYYNASVGKQSDEGKDNRFHKSKELVKERQDANNARQRDLFGRVRNKVGVTKLLNYEDAKHYVESFLQAKLDPTSYESALIDYLDYTKELEDSTSDSSEDS